MKKFVGALAVLVAAVLGSAVLAGCSSSGGTPSPPKASALVDHVATGPYQGFGLTPPLPRPSFTLTDTAGKPYAFGQRTQGKATLLFFGYTNCPDVCPATMADIGVALRQLPADVAGKVTVVFVSTDVKHDTGAVIARWLANFSPNTHATFVGLRGTQSQIDAAEAASHVLLSEDGGRTHSSQVLLFSPDDYAHVAFIYNNTGEAEQIRHDVQYVVSGNS